MREARETTNTTENNTQISYLSYYCARHDTETPLIGTVKRSPSGRKRRNTRGEYSMSSSEQVPPPASAKVLKQLTEVSSLECALCLDFFPSLALSLALSLSLSTPSTPHTDHQFALRASAFAVIMCSEQVRICAEDLIEEVNQSCATCLEDFSLLDSVIRLPCGHCYCPPCVTAWLQKQCTCPSCRYEYQTENRDYEIWRIKKMASRRLKYTRQQLTDASVGHLKTLAETLCV